MTFLVHIHYRNVNKDVKGLSPRTKKSHVVMDSKQNRNDFYLLFYGQFLDVKALQINYKTI